MYTAELLVPYPSPLEVEIAVATLKRYKSLHCDQIPAELIQGESETLWPDIHKLINSIWNEEELPDQWKESVIVPVYKNVDKTDFSNYCGISLLSNSYKILSDILHLRLSPYRDEIFGDHSFDVPDQLLITFFAFVRYQRKYWRTMRQYNSCS
jgi:hypothetical protein